MISEIKNTLLKKINDELALQGLSQSELARKMGLSRQAINNYLEGKREATSINKLIEILEVLNVNVKVVFN